MRETYYKAVRPDGTDFYSGTVQWAPLMPKGGRPWVVTHPTAKRRGANAGKYLSVATVPTDCTGMRWPCRLLEVAPTGRRRVVNIGGPYPNKRVGLSFTVLRELPAHEALGPQGLHVAALIESIPGAVRGAARGDAWGAVRGAVRGAARGDAWGAARGAAQDVARGAARGDAWGAARGAAQDAVWGVAEDAAWGLVVRDLITPAHYDTLTRPWRTHIGPIHPDDPDLRGAA